VRRVLIAGVSNILLGDDGVGPYVARLLDSRYQFEETVRVEDLGTPALDFVTYLIGCDALIVIDSVDDGEAAGHLSLYHKLDLTPHASAYALSTSPTAAVRMNDKNCSAVLLFFDARRMTHACSIGGYSPAGISA